MTSCYLYYLNTFVYIEVSDDDNDDYDDNDSYTNSTNCLVFSKSTYVRIPTKSEWYLETDCCHSHKGAR